MSGKGLTGKLYDISEELDELISNIDDLDDISGDDLKNVKNRDISRPMATKLIWLYIKQENLQNESNKREIYCDDILQKLSGKKKITMFEISKLLKDHLF